MSRDVELGIDAVAEQVHRQVDDVDVAGALAVAEQRALDAVRAGHHAELRGGDAHPRSLCGCRLSTTRSRLRIVRPNHSMTSP